MQQRPPFFITCLAALCLAAGCTHSPDDDAAPTASAIKHLVVIVQENHTFDNYFGRYCTAAPGSQPSCQTGPACCEAAPTADPGFILNVAYASWGPDNGQIGYRSDEIATPAQIAEIVGVPAWEIVRLETVAEDVARAGVTADGYAAQFVAALDSPFAGHQDVYFNEAAGAGFAGAQGMVIDTLCLIGA